MSLALLDFEDIVEDLDRILRGFILYSEDFGILLPVVFLPLIFDNFVIFLVVLVLPSSFSRPKCCREGDPWVKT